MNPVRSTSLTCSTREAARLLGVSVRTAQLWVEDGRLRAWKTPGGHRRILVESVERLVDEQRRAGATSGPDASSVLILKENARDRRALQALLGSVLSDCTVWAVASGFEGLIRIGEIRPDVLITDLGVTGLDFFQMIHSLLDDVREHPMVVVVLLASGVDRAAVSARLPGDVVLVEPPFDGHELAALVWGLLQKHKRATLAQPVGLSASGCP